MGGDCSQRVCPFGPAWSGMALANDTAHQSVECSNRGICDRTQGTCNCQSGFTGTACERLACSNDCSSSGKCISYYDYARTTRYCMKLLLRNVVSLLVMT
jgi:hypothetical protein